MTLDLQPTEAVVVRPGEKLVLRYARQLTMEEAATVKERVAQLFPGVDAGVVGGVEEMLVYRPVDTK